MENFRRPLWQRLPVLMALEIPHQQDQEENDSEHENGKVMPGGIRAAPCGARFHDYLDAVFATKLRSTTKLKETLPINIFRN